MSDQDIMITPIPGVDNLSYEQVNIITQFQKLWMEFLFWTKSFFRSSLKNDGDLSAITTRVFAQIPQDFNDEFQKYFNNEETQQFNYLFSQLITTHWQLITAFKNNSQEAIEASDKQWNHIAGELSAFLSSINPYWNETQWRNLFYDYERLKIQDMRAYISQNYDQEATIFNDLEEQILKIAAYMAEGIIMMQPNIQAQYSLERYLFHY